MSELLDRLFDLRGRTVVVTGGYGLIGRALVNGLADAGATVVNLDRQVSDEADARAFGERAGAGRVISLAADVIDRVSLEAAAAEVSRRFGAPWGLVNNAALDSPPDAPAEENGPFETYPEASFDKVMDVNVKGVLLTTQVFGALMAEAGEGAIVNVSSIYGTVTPDQGLYQYRRDRGETFYKPVAYAASKSALYNLTRYVAGYWGGRGVRCNTVTFSGVFNGQEAAFLEAYRPKIPLSRGPEHDARGRMASAEDYLGPVLFLLSPASGYMTGADLRVDGGYLAL